MSTKCNLCGGEVSLGEGGVTSIDHDKTCAHAIEVEWVNGNGGYPDVPGVDSGVTAEIGDFKD